MGDYGEISKTKLRDGRTEGQQRYTHNALVFLNSSETNEDETFLKLFNTICKMDFFALQRYTTYKSI
jgi:hypothetical protein